MEQTITEMENEIMRVEIEGAMIGCEWRGVVNDGNGGMSHHHMQDDKTGRYFAVANGQEVYSAWKLHSDAVEIVSQSIKNLPLVSTGPSGIGGQYNRDYAPLFKHHKRVGLVARLLNKLRRD